MSDETDIPPGFLKRLKTMEKTSRLLYESIKHLEAASAQMRVISGTYAYIWERPGGAIEVDIRHLYTPAIPPITRGLPDDWDPGEPATLTIDSFTISDADGPELVVVEFMKHLEMDRHEIEAEIIESIEANLTDC